MEFKVTAAQYGNRVDFEIGAGDTMEALRLAKHEARRIFEYSGVGDEPTVAVRPIKEKE